jgi:hypothetical protein
MGSIQKVSDFLTGRFASVTVAAVGLLFTACSQSSPDMLVKRHSANVWAGSPDRNNLPLLTNDEPQKLQNRDRIKTDKEGEGWLYLDDCPAIYLFQDSGLVKSINSKVSRESGNITSLLSGTAIWRNHCANKIAVLETDTAEIQLEGTWVKATYFPEQQLSIVAVFEGQAKVRPVINKGSQMLGDEVLVKEGYFWFSALGQQNQSILGLTPRQAHPFKELPRLIVGLNSWNYLWQWLPRTEERAKNDKIPFPPLIINRCKVVAKGNNQAWVMFNKPIGDQDGTNPPKGTVEKDTSFIATARTSVNKEDWTFGASPQYTGWIASNALDCNFPIVQLTSIPPGDIGVQPPVNSQSKSDEQGQQNKQNQDQQDQKNKTEPDVSSAVTANNPENNLNPAIVISSQPQITPDKMRRGRLDFKVDGLEPKNIKLIEIYDDNQLVKSCRQTQICSHTTTFPDGKKRKKIFQVRVVDSSGRTKDEKIEYEPTTRR